MTAAGFTLAGAGHPIIPVMLGDARVAAEMATRLLAEGRLRDRVLVPGGAARPGPDPHPDVGRALRRRHHDGGRRLHARSVARWGWCHEGAREGRARAGALDGGRRHPDAGRRRGADPGPQDVDLRHRPAHPPLGRSGRRRRSRCRWSSATSSWARSRRLGAEVRRPRGRPAGRRRGPHHLRSLPQLQGRPPRVLPQPHRRRCHPSGAFAEYVVFPPQNVFAVPDHIDDDVAAVLDPLGNATHTALALRRGRRGRADHRCRPDRRDGHRDRPPHRRPPHRGHRRQPVPARPGGPSSGATTVVDVVERAARRGDDRARHDRGLRRRASRCRAPRRPSTRCSTR